MNLSRFISSVRDWVGLAALAWLTTVGSAQVMPGRQALALDGESSFVELPREVFSGLREATVEGWIKWERLDSFSRFFDYGAPFRSVAVLHHETSPDLMFHVWPSQRRASGIQVSGILRSNEWCHIAAVSGPRGMRLYFNGIAVGDHSSTVSFSEMGSSARAYLGKSAWFRRDALTKGQLAEVRVWNVARSEGEIRDGLFRRMTGTEQGLVALWPFDGTAQDLGPRQFHAVIRGRILYSQDELPSANAMPQFALVDGRVRDPFGTPINAVWLNLEHEGRTRTYSRSGMVGDFKLASHGSFRMASYDLRVPLRIEAMATNLLFGSTNVQLQPGDVYRLNMQLGPVGAGGRFPSALLGFFARELTNANVLKRISAARRLADAGAAAEEVEASLVAALQDSDRDVRLHASAALNHFQTASLRQLEALIRLLESPDTDPAVRNNAEGKLKRVKLPDSLQEYFTRKSVAMTYLFSGLLISFTLLHFVLYISNPAASGNFLYAVYCGASAAATILLENRGNSGVPPIAFFATYFAALIFALRLIYFLFLAKLPRRFWFFTAYWPFFVLIAWIFPRLDRDVGFFGGMAFFYLLILGEILRVINGAIRAKLAGAGIIGLGFVLMILCQIGSVLAFTNPSVKELLGPALAANLFNISVMAFVLSNSFFLARQFALTNKNLLQVKSEIEAASA